MSYIRKMVGIVGLLCCIGNNVSAGKQNPKKIDKKAVIARVNKEAKEPLTPHQLSKLELQWQKDYESALLIHDTETLNTLEASTYQDVNFVDGKGDTLLIKVAKAGHTKALQRLVNKKIVNKDLRDLRNDPRALPALLASDLLSPIKWECLTILNNYFSLNVPVFPNRENILHQIVKDNDIYILRRLLSEPPILITKNNNYKMNVNVTDKDGNTPLHLAMQCPPDNEIIELLINKGANIYHQNQWGQTPLDVLKETNSWESGEVCLYVPELVADIEYLANN